MSYAVSGQTSGQTKDTIILAKDVAAEPQTPVEMDLDRLTIAVTRLMDAMDRLAARTSGVRSNRPQVASEVAEGAYGTSVLSEAIATQTRRLSDIADSVQFMLDTLEV